MFCLFFPEHIHIQNPAAYLCSYLKIPQQLCQAENRSKICLGLVGMTLTLIMNISRRIWAWKVPLEVQISINHRAKYWNSGYKISEVWCSFRIMNSTPQIFHTLNLNIFPYDLLKCVPLKKVLFIPSFFFKINNFKGFSGFYPLLVLPKFLVPLM